MKRNGVSLCCFAVLFFWMPLSLRPNGVSLRGIGQTDYESGKSVISFTDSARFEGEESYDFFTIDQPDDYEGRVVSTFIAHKGNSHRERAVLYLHGYNDYFFQYQMGDSVLAHGLDFYAVELRKYGRSKLEHQRWFEVKDLSEYYSDLDSAISRIKANGTTKIYLLAHSTGGLIGSLYLNERQDEKAIRAMVLNSPFLDYNLSAFVRNGVIPVVSFFRPMIGKMKISQGESRTYANSLLKDYGGEWVFDTTMKFPVSPAVTVNWLSAIKKGHRKIARGLSIKQPVLVMSSNRSNAEAETSDVVLNYKHIQKRADNLGNNVEKLTIPNGKHDLALAIKPARERFYKELFRFLDEHK